MELGSFFGDYPRTLVIETAGADQVWTARWKGNAAAAAFAGLVRHPQQAPVTFAWPAVQAQRLRLRQIGENPKVNWSIAELSVFGR